MSDAAYQIVRDISIGTILASLLVVALAFFVMWSDREGK